MTFKPPTQMDEFHIQMNIKQKTTYFCPSINYNKFIFQLDNNFYNKFDKNCRG